MFPLFSIDFFPICTFWVFFSPIFCSLFSTRFPLNFHFFHARFCLFCLLLFICQELWASPGEPVEWGWKIYFFSNFWTLQATAGDGVIGWGVVSLGGLFLRGYGFPSSSAKKNASQVAPSIPDALTISRKENGVLLSKDINELVFWRNDFLQKN